MKCPHCDNTETFWVVEVMKSWVQINTVTETYEDKGEIEENYFDQERYQCGKCEKFVNQKWDAWIAD